MAAPPQSFYQFKECCLKGNELPGTTKGTIIAASDSLPLPHYIISSTPTSTVTKKIAIVILYDIFGFKIPNPKLIADTLQAQLSSTYPSVRITVYVPDFLGDRAAPESALAPLLPDTPGQKKPLLPKLGAIPQILYNIGLFKVMKSPETLDKITKFLQGVKAEGFEKIGTAGYCLGASNSLAILSGLELTSTEKKSIVDTAIFLHPGPVDQTQLEALTIPQAWYCASHDDHLKLDRVNEISKTLEEAKTKGGPEFVVRVFPGTVHGWASRPALQHEELRTQFLAAGEATRDWFAKHLIE